MRFPRFPREIKIGSDYSQDLLPGWAKEVHSKIQKYTKTMKKENWKFVIQTIIAILTAIATSLGVTSCMN